MGLRCAPPGWSHPPAPTGSAPSGRSALASRGPTPTRGATAQWVAPPLPRRMLSHPPTRNSRASRAEPQRPPSQMGAGGWDCPRLRRRTRGWVCRWCPRRLFAGVGWAVSLPLGVAMAGPGAGGALAGFRLGGGGWWGCPRCCDGWAGCGVCRWCLAGFRLGGGGWWGCPRCCDGWARCGCSARGPRREGWPWIRVAGPVGVARMHAPGWGWGHLWLRAAGPGRGVLPEVPRRSSGRGRWPGPVLARGAAQALPGCPQLRTAGPGAWGPQGGRGRSGVRCGPRGPAPGGLTPKSPWSGRPPPTAGLGRAGVGGRG
ncbi:hypothetical protein FHS40_002869 [Streptomyces spectabilis]|uniref:Uncharacterized protein n=1 Tax=Streptomyces spectabilis TaxID=68270 RepID=A0A7W8AUZ1_STRST|nr:hypothetical protein [Streptomyces spectabilis]